MKETHKYTFMYSASKSYAEGYDRIFKKKKKKKVAKRKHAVLKK